MTDFSIFERKFIKLTEKKNRGQFRGFLPVYDTAL